VTVIHNGVDTGHFSPQQWQGEFAGVPATARVIVSVGRLVGWKGLHTIVDALAGLPADVHFLAIGEGTERDALEQRAADCGIATRVHFAGRIPHAELPRWLVRGDVFVQPSIGEEAFGISVVEAMACGLPVLAADNGGMREIVAPGVTGRLLPPGDVPAWQAALAELMDDKARRAALGIASRQRAIDHFTWAANAAALELMLAEA
jgi:glycosyltransferase involved in cell wall biosynthesis